MLSKYKFSKTIIQQLDVKYKKNKKWILIYFVNINYLYIFINNLYIKIQNLILNHVEIKFIE